MTHTRKSWGRVFAQTVIEAGGRVMAVQTGTAWKSGHCAIHLHAGEMASAVCVHVVEEPQDGGSGNSTTDRKNLLYAVEIDDPFVAATMVLRWVNSREGDSVAL